MVNDPTTVASGFAEVHSARLYYEIQGEGPALVLVHAGIADRRMWDAQVPAFAERYRVIRYDARGFGNSVQPPEAFSRSGDLLGLLNHLGIERAAIVAASMGGATAIDFALAHPTMVAGMVLVAPSIGGRTPPEIVKRCWVEEDTALARGDFAAATEVNLRLWVDGPQRPPHQVDATVRARVAEMQLRAFTVADIEADEVLLDPPAITRLHAIAAPMLVLVGDLDLPDKLVAANELAAATPHANVRVIAGGAHMVNMEQPEAFNAAALAFLDGLTRSPHRPSRPQSIGSDW